MAIRSGFPVMLRSLRIVLPDTAACIVIFSETVQRLRIILRLRAPGAAIMGYALTAGISAGTGPCGRIIPCWFRRSTALLSMLRSSLYSCFSTPPAPAALIGALRLILFPDCLEAMIRGLIHRRPEPQRKGKALCRILSEFLPETAVSHQGFFEVFGIAKARLCRTA